MKVGAPCPGQFTNIAITTSVKLGISVSQTHSTFGLKIFSGKSLVKESVLGESAKREDECDPLNRNKNMLVLTQFSLSVPCSNIYRCFPI